MSSIKGRVTEKRSREKRQGERVESYPDEDRRDPRSQDYVRHANIITGRDASCSPPSCPRRRYVLSKVHPRIELTETHSSKQMRKTEMKNGSVCTLQTVILSW